MRLSNLLSQAPNELFFSSKKSKIQSHNLAPAILEDLMPITAEHEPEDPDDDTPSRVCLFITNVQSLVQIFSSLPFALSTGSRLSYPRHKFSPLSELLFFNTFHRPTRHFAVVQSLHLVSLLKDVASS